MPDKFPPMAVKLNGEIAATNPCKWFAKSERNFPKQTDHDQLIQDRPLLLKLIVSVCLGDWCENYIWVNALYGAFDKMGYSNICKYNEFLYYNIQHCPDMLEEVYFKQEICH